MQRARTQVRPGLGHQHELSDACEAMTTTTTLLTALEGHRFVERSQVLQASARFPSARTFSPVTRPHRAEEADAPLTGG